jgi:hypothetical protein
MNGKLNEWKLVKKLKNDWIKSILKEDELIKITKKQTGMK